MGWTKDDTLKTAPLPSWSRIFAAGHSWAGGGGAASMERSWLNVLAGMLKADLKNLAVGGAVLAYNTRGATGDGGWAWLVNSIYKQPPEVNWTGGWSGAYAYQTRDGVLYNGGWYMWAATGATATGGGAPVPGGANGWLRITGPGDAGASKWEPPTELLVPFFGNNDLGFHKNLSVFREALIYALTVCSASFLYDDSWGCISYDASFGARVAANRKTSFGANGFVTLPNTNGATITINVPADFPGGAVSLLFIRASSSQGRLTTTVDGAAGPTKNFAVVNGAGGFDVPAGFGTLTQTGTAAVPASNVPGVFRIAGLAAGPHTIVVKVDTSTSTMGNVYFDGVAIENSSALPDVVFPSLFKPVTYQMWSNYYTVTDADVDAWNADVQANVLPLFPNVTYVDISNALNKDPHYFIYDSTHPNDEGHAILARIVFDALGSLNRSSNAQSRRNAFPMDYAIEFFPAAGDTITPSTDMGDVVVINLPAGNVTINTPTGSAQQGRRIKFLFAQGAVGGGTVTMSGYGGLPPAINTAAWAVSTAEYVQFGTGPTPYTANWILMAQQPVDPQTPALTAVRQITESRILMSNLPAVETTVYTAPADVTAALIPELYFFNTAAAPITVTVKVAGIVVWSGSVGASVGTVKGTVPPLRPGDTMTVTTTAVGVNVWAPVWASRDPSIKVILSTGAAANAGTNIYTVPTGKKARLGPYISNVFGPLNIIGPNVNVSTVFAINPGTGWVNVYQLNVTFATNSVTVNPVSGILQAGDSFMVIFSSTGCACWLMVQEFM